MNRQFPTRHGQSYSVTMRTDKLTTSLLAIIALSLAVLAGENFRSRSTVVHAAPVSTQAWEYKSIVRVFECKNGQMQGVTSMSEDQKPLPAVVDIVAKLNELGDQGWELVSVTPYSSYSQAGTSTANSTQGPAAGYSWNGVTSLDRWIFKRPKAPTGN